MQPPHKPSIAVLPFNNMSGDPEQEYFADGMVEEITTALSRTRWLFVIARNSSFTYKGRAVDVKQVGRELGVRYVLEGGVRKSADRVRITAQLIDASTGAHLWADRFDGSLENIFELQDQVTASVVGAIAPRLEQAEVERAKHKPTESLDAYDYFLRGIASLHSWTKESNDEALRLFNKAIELDPDFASAYRHGLVVLRSAQGESLDDSTACKRLPKPRGWLVVRRSWAGMTRLRWLGQGLHLHMLFMTSKSAPPSSIGPFNSIRTSPRHGILAAGRRSISASRKLRSSTWRMLCA